MRRVQKLNRLHEVKDSLEIAHNESMTKRTEAMKQREVGKSKIEVMKFPETPAEIFLEMMTV